jgi:hypothetical protein
MYLLHPPTEAVVPVALSVAETCAVAACPGGEKVKGHHMGRSAAGGLGVAGVMAVVLPDTDADSAGAGLAEAHIAVAGVGNRAVVQKCLWEERPYSEVVGSTIDLA